MSSPLFLSKIKLAVVVLSNFNDKALLGDAQCLQLVRILLVYNTLVCQPSFASCADACVMVRDPCANNRNYDDEEFISVIEQGRG